MSKYAVTAEFYDLLQAVQERERAYRLFAAPAARAHQGIIEVGSGSGLVTQILADAARVPVHAVEPDEAMRALLMSRLATAPAHERDRVTVHPECIQELVLEDGADLAVCSNVIATLTPAQRRGTWDALAGHISASGILLIDPPPTRVPSHPEITDLPRVAVGEDTYSGFLRASPEAERTRLHYTYQVYRDGVLLREEHDEFVLWPVTSTELHDELRAAGWTCEPAADAEGILLARPAQ